MPGAPFKKYKMAVADDVSTSYNQTHIFKHQILFESCGLQAGLCSLCASCRQISDVPKRSNCSQQHKPSLQTALQFLLAWSPWALCNKHPGLHLPLHITHENSNEVKDVLQGISRSLQDVISKTPQENEEVTQIISKELCKQRL